MARSAKQVASQLKAAKASAVKRRSERLLRAAKAGKPSTRHTIGLPSVDRGAGIFGDKPLSRAERVRNAATKGKKASDIAKTLGTYKAPVLSPGQVRKARKAGNIAYGAYEELQGNREAAHRFGRKRK